MKITAASAQAFSFPTEFPREADGTLSWTKTTLVIAEIQAGDQTGIGYTYSDHAAAVLINDVLCKMLVGGEAMDIPSLHERLVQRSRNFGRPGIASHAISALDVALWDLKAKHLGLSLTELLGRARAAVPIYGSGGFTSYTVSQLQDQLSRWVKEGIPRVKMKIGGDLETTLDRVRAARLAIGLKTELYVDANGAYSPRQATRLAERLGEHEVSWLEEPVSSDDLDGLAFVRQHAPPEMTIAAGEYGQDTYYFDRLIQAGAVDVVQIDATRCLGVTGFLKAAALCGTRHKEISTHTAPQLHAHLGCVVPEVRHGEYFSDHVRIESLVFDGALRPENGALCPDPARPGLGIELKRKDAERFAA